MLRIIGRERSPADDDLEAGQEVKPSLVGRTPIRAT
jgi:hypothetical protein